MSINPLIFREYDIRGIAGKELTEPLLEDLGRVFARHVQSHLPAGKSHPVIAVGRDGRLSSPGLAQAMARGLARSGAEVIDVGLGPSPMLYFATHLFQADAGVMITGSHNPPDYNGIKMVHAGLSVYGAEIQRLRQLLEAGVPPAVEGGRVRQEEITQRYVQRLIQDFQPGRPMHVILDCGNGVAGVVAQAVLDGLPNVRGEVLFPEVDGTFPNHHPDPTVPKNLEHLRRRMQETGAELGIAFDGDGDRIGALDEQGRIVWGDRLMILFSRQILPHHQGATVIGDVKCSQLLFDAVAAAGGAPLMWKTGHSLVKAKMKETHALLAGEMSGHLFFADRYYGYDDALYAAVRLVEAVASTPASLSARLADLPVIHATPELRLFCPDDRKFGVMERVAAAQRAAGSDLSDVDGVRVRVPGGWWLIRVSNTQPALVARVEAESRERLHAIVAQVEALLTAEGVAFPPWHEA